MKSITSILFIFSILYSLKGQVQIDSTLYYDTSYIGSVKTISNKKVCRLALFVSEPNEDWTLKEKKRILKQEDKAFSWIKKQALEYGVDFKIDRKTYFLEKDHKVDDIPIKLTKNIKNPRRNQAEKIFAELGDSGAQVFSEKELSQYPGGFFVIIYYKGEGRSSASPVLTPKDLRTIPEFVSLFAKRQGKPLTSRTIAHEILHLFGAWDLYNDNFYGPSSIPHWKIFNRFYNSIMLTRKKLKNLNLDTLTAWRVGLHNKPEDWFLDIVPLVYHKKSYITD